MISDIVNIGRARVLALPLAALLLATACQPVSQLRPASSPAASSRGSVTPSPTPAAKHVFVIVLENTSYQLALRQPYIASLAQQYAVATNYGDVGNPSLPNYLAMTSGSTWGIRDDNFHKLPATGIGNQLTDAGISWKAYMEGFTGDCFNSPYPYALKHNPFVYYGGTCPANVVPMTDLASDLKGDTPQLAWITPGLCNDGHDCGIKTADRWLSQVVPQITSSTAWQQGGALFITWDESSAGDRRVALLVVAPGVHGELTMALDHFSLLATISDRLGVARLGLAQQATSLTKQLQAGAAQSSSSSGQERSEPSSGVAQKRADYHRGTDETPDEILEYYTRGGEQIRFENAQGQLEALRTQELLARLLPAPPADILDVGGRPGYYARWLATRGYSVTLVEPIPLHVEQASEMATRDGLRLTARLGDARLLEFADGSKDAVLELGPLYHLTEGKDRVQALAEAARVTKPGGLIIVALISRFASLLDGLRMGMIDRPGTLAAIEADLRTGQHRNPTRHPAWFTTAYFHHPDEVASEFDSAHITLEQLIGIEGPAWLSPDLQERLGDPDRRERVLQAVRMVEREPRMVGISAHLMAIGRSPERRST